MWTQTRPVRSNEARAALGRGKESRVPGVITRMPRPAEESLLGGPRLGRTGVTRHEQRWAERRRAGRQRVTPGEAMCCLLRMRRGTPLFAPDGATARVPSPAEGSLPGRPRLGRTGVTKREQSSENRAPVSDSG
ncbi:hypothetical protein NDU88_002160 [Pleurodeles waltl]|uniref:Uncharacterized protein n=1 Tax=Pleurodeles waltl TaxID=8319 RepID=A0AAV7M0Q6_PLEWA|nr:hypothetical protein NDU88_002160 [Pleurodeles waltl]